MRLCYRSPRHELLESRNLLATVQIPHNLTGVRAAEVTVPVHVDDADGIRAADIRIAYDANSLEIHPADIVAGSVWSGKALAVANVDPQQGLIRVFVFAAEPLEQSAGSLLDARFTVRPDACVREAVIDLTELRLNEGEVELETVPREGRDATDGSIAISYRPLARDPYDGPLSGALAPGDHPSALDALYVRWQHPADAVEVSSADQPSWSAPGQPLRRRSGQTDCVKPALDVLLASTEDWSPGLATGDDWLHCLSIRRIGGTDQN